VNNSVRNDKELALPLAALTTLLIAGLLVTVRGEIGSQVTVLVLALCVVGAAAVGGRAAGLASAAVAAVAFDFFHTRPYYSLKIDSLDDALAALLLLLIGLAVGQVATTSIKRQSRVVTQRFELRAVERVGRLVADGSDVADVESAVRAELLGILSLAGCRYTPGATTRAVLQESGRVATHIHRYREGGFELPAEGVAIPVRVRGTIVGHLECDPVPDVGIGIGGRRAAVVLSELLGASMMSLPPTVRSERA
jgi:hypothetical protein